MLPPPLAKALGVGGEPKEYLQIEKLNEKLTSFEYSLRKASVSPASAKRERARQSLARQFGSEFAAFGLDAATVERVLEATKAYRKKEERLTSQIEKKLMAVRADKLLARGGGKGGGSKHAEGEASAEGEEKGGGFLSGGAQVFARMGGAMGSSAAMKEVSRLQQQQIELELSFLARLSEIVSKDQAAALASVLQPSSSRAKGVAGGQGGGAVSAAAAGESLGGRLDALNALVDAATEAASKSKHVYVLKFFGDVTASQVAQLRQEITAVLTSAEAEERADEVVLVLNTGGGTVTGYGLAASQLLRLKEAGLPLTICVEQVAASGGYMMACVADRLVASPFAVLGSIGVITEQPNVYERLKREGISFSTITAGKYKRTLTPTKKVDPLDEKKLKSDIEQVLKLFKGFVAQNRPSLDIDKIATGETWFGPDALERNMVDKLATVDEVLLDYVDKGAQVFGLKYTEKPPSPLAALGIGGSAGEAAPLAQLALSWLLARGRDGGGEGAALLEALRKGSASGDALGAARLQSTEPPFLAARPRDAAEPMVRWGDAEGSESDSWHM
mmetsp:Transcript_25303/g.75333  ORF Transcript_25303/g.75333 Transcript_25303/m.75333 type:complete len:561 (-) Transcript_25303:81-1763(-)